MEKNNIELSTAVYESTFILCPSLYIYAGYCQTNKLSGHRRLAPVFFYKQYAVQEKIRKYKMIEICVLILKN